MKKHFIKTYIPTLSSFGYCGEILNKDYIFLNKLIKLNDDSQFNEFITSFLDDKMISSLDKFFGLVYLRILCVKETIKIVKKGTEINLNLDLKLVLKNILNLKRAPLNDFHKEKIHIKFKLPTTLFFNNFIHLLEDIVDDLKIEDTDINYNHLNKKDRLKLLSRIKKEIIIDIKSHIKNNCDYINVTGVNNELVKDSFCFYDNSGFYYIKFLFNSSISYIYKKLYYCCQNLNLTYSDYNEMTSSETDILLTIYKSSNNIK